MLTYSGTTACTHTLTGHSKSVRAIAYSPQGDQLASASEDYTIQLWDARSGECTHVLIGHTKPVKGIMYSPNGNQVLSYSDDSTLLIWDVETGVCNHNLTGHCDGIRSVAYSPQGDQIVSGGGDTTVRVWDVGTGECRHILSGHTKRMSALAYSPKGKQIASGGGDGSLKVWDTEAGTCLWILTGHTREVNKIVYSSRGDVVISASDDMSVRLWDVTSGQCRAVIEDYKDRVMDIAWIETPGMNYLVVGCEDGFVGMWQVKFDQDNFHVTLRWKPTKAELDVEDATIQDVQGLSQLDKQLLIQRGAVGEPAHRLRDTIKKVNTMASVVSTLKTPSGRLVEDSDSTVKAMAEQLQQWVEQVKDPMLQDLVALVVKYIQAYS